MSAYWLVKTEPNTFSIDDLQRNGVTQWDGVRNYQARNFLKQMKPDDTVLVYHSNAEPSGVVGVAKVAKLAYPDKTQFDSKSKYYDDTATKDAPRWFAPDLKFVKKFSSIVPLPELREQPVLRKMALLQRGSRLSVMPVTAVEFRTIVALTK